MSPAALSKWNSAPESGLPHFIAYDFACFQVFQRRKSSLISRSNSKTAPASCGAVLTFQNFFLTQIFNSIMAAKQSLLSPTISDPSLPPNPITASSSYPSGMISGLPYPLTNSDPLKKSQFLGRLLIVLPVARKLS